MTKTQFGPKDLNHETNETNIKADY